MSDTFRELLKRVGSGPHTSTDLTRTEARDALCMMLQEEATPAQIGAFMIAHRIKRPTGEELTGFLDALQELGPNIPDLGQTDPVVVFSNPYDGRSRTAPLFPISALMLATAGVNVLMHGSDTMPTKYGIPILKVWHLLGIQWQGQSLEQVTQILKTHNLGFLYMGDHFPQFQTLIPYREQIGKRPPLATAELFWCPYEGPTRLVSGYVHPPTETKLMDAFHCREQGNYTTVKGLEGSIDLPRDRTAIIGVHQPGQPELERLLLHARDHNLGGPEIPYESPDLLAQQMQQLLQGEDSVLLPGVLWNSGFYLWHLGPCESLDNGIALAQDYLQSGKLQQTVMDLQSAVQA